MPEASKKGSIVLGESLTKHTKPWVRARATPDYWHGCRPASGRPCCPSMSQPDEWNVTAGDEQLIQKKEATGRDLK